jgi:hypothetical protein
MKNRTAVLSVILLLVFILRLAGEPRQWKVSPKDGMTEEAMMTQEA